MGDGDRPALCTHDYTNQVPMPEDPQMGLNKRQTFLQLSEEKEN
jgi:hypothetical protein